MQDSTPDTVERRQDAIGRMRPVSIRPSSRIDPHRAVVVAALAEDQPLTWIARELGVSYTTLWRWVAGRADAIREEVEREREIRHRRIREARLRAVERVVEGMARAAEGLWSPTQEQIRAAELLLEPVRDQAPAGGTPGTGAAGAQAASVVHVHVDRDGGG